MAHTKPFFHHVAHVTGLMAPAPEPERYPYHDNDQCPEGQTVKSSGEWQYYQAVPGEERVRCPICVEFDQAER